jgi:hypothetical protein
MDQINTSQTSQIPSFWFVIKNSFRLYFKKIKTLVLIGAVPSLLVIFDYIFNTLKIFSLSSFFSFVSFIISFFYYPALFWAVANEKESTPFLLAKEAYKNSKSFFLPYLVILGLAYLSVVGGMILFIIGGVYVGVLVSLAPYVLVCEFKKAKDALAFSWLYIKGNWWNVFIKYLLMSFVVGLMFIFVGFLQLFSAGLFAVSLFSKTQGLSFYDPITLFVTLVSFGSFFVVKILWYLLFIPLLASFGYLIYQSLSLAKKSLINDDLINKAKKSVSRFIILGIIVLVLAIILSSRLLINLF